MKLEFLLFVVVVHSCWADSERKKRKIQNIVFRYKRSKIFRSTMKLRKANVARKAKQKPGIAACAVILATGTVEIGRNWMPTTVGDP
jgi:hypothetical protein